MAVVMVAGPVGRASVAVVAAVVPRGWGRLLAVLVARGSTEAPMTTRGSSGRGLGSGRGIATPLLARFSEVDLLDAARRGEAVVAPVGVVALVGAQGPEVVRPGAGATVAVALRELEERLGRGRRGLPHRALGRVELRRLGHKDRLRVRHLLLGQQLRLRRQSTAFANASVG
jgi:hypothetical protein